MASKAEIAKKTEGGAVMPAFMEEDLHLGTEAIGSNAMEIPRIKLLQALSPELEEDEDLRQGMWFHTILEEQLGKDLLVIPCYSTLSYMLWRPQGDGGGILARADDGVNWTPPDMDFNVTLKGGQEVCWRTAPTVAASRLHLFGTENPTDPTSPPAAVAMINVAVLAPGHLELGPFVLTFQRSGFKVGKKFMSNLKLSRVPSFGRIFQAYSTRVEGKEGPYLEPRMKAKGFVEDKAVYAQAKSAYETFKKLGIRVKEETMGEDAAEAGDGSAADTTEY